MKNKIEVVHPKYGPLSFLVELLEHKKYPQVEFFYPTGTRMGGLDSERGGSLGFPTEAVNEFMRLQKEHGEYGIHFLDFDEHGYCALEDVLQEAVHQLWPTFWSKDIAPRPT